MVCGERLAEDVLCNRCGESCSVQIMTGDEVRNFEAAEVTRSHGYGSSQDGTLQRWHLCDSCTTEATKDWKMPPEECEYLSGERLPKLKVWSTHHSCKAKL